MGKLIELIGICLRNNGHMKDFDSHYYTSYFVDKQNKTHFDETHSEMMRHSRDVRVRSWLITSVAILCGVAITAAMVLRLIGFHF